MIQINIDFELMYKDHAADSLTKMWPNISKNPNAIYKIELDPAIDAFHIDDERHDFLTYLKLLPAHKTKFENAVASMIIFVDVRVQFIKCLNSSCS